ncbi:ribonuclease E/G [Desulfurivibrio sp. D14AmB]|uniref:Rne/Rng family ribonuclease n=1 Tax=Desulfurivibrio sp. D14AmB TaxID=3374370 RepID=UPI00376F0925
MSDDQSRSVLDRVSQWLGRKKEQPEKNNQEERGTMPEKEKLKSEITPQAAAPKAPERKPPAAAAPDGGEARSEEQPAERSEAAKASRALSASARRRNQRARAKERAAREATAAQAADQGTAPDLETAPTEQPETATAAPSQPKAKARAKAKPKATAKAAAPKAATKAKPKAKPKSAAKPASEEEAPSPAKPGSGYKLLINTDEPEECRLALLENGKVEGFFIESVSRAQIKGNIYKGRITSVEANLQAAFVDIGLPKNGFLSFSEIHPEYYSQEVGPETHWKNLKIQDVVKKGQEVLVEVVKEATGNKGPSLTTYISLPGRCLVLMPGSDSSGISRKIDDEAQRRKLREMVEGLNIPEGIGYIIRTASQEITKTSLGQDLRYLLNLWEEIKKNGQTMAAPALIYKEQNIISRFLRDHYTTDIREILVDDEEAADQVRDFLQLLPAAQRKKTAVKLHQGSQPIFHQYHVEKQIEQMFQPTVALPSGGSIVINPTEALVAIDVNSGRTSSKDRDFEESIFIANMEAAEELARQLRMRDLGGLIVVDFIDMRSAAHTREVEKKVRECMKKDKAKVDFSKISKFGLMQISRQKMAAPLQTTSYKTCPHCEGRGMIRSVENMALSHLRQIQTGMSRRQAKKVLCRLPMEVAQYILNKKRGELLELEKEYGAEIAVEIDPAMMPADHKIDFIRE